MGGKLTRRRFLQSSGGALALALVHLRPCGVAEAAVEAGSPSSASPEGPLSYQAFGDVYRRKWTWDRVVKGTHYVNCGYQRGCAWNVSTSRTGSSGERSRSPTTSRPTPRCPTSTRAAVRRAPATAIGCTTRSRLTHPLKRVGRARREGQVEARSAGIRRSARSRTQTIDAMIVGDRMVPAPIYWDLGSGMSNGCHGLGLTRTGYLLDTPILENTTEIGDHMPGVTTTLGKLVFNSSMDDLHYSDLILIWGGKSQLHPHSERPLHLRGPLQRRLRRDHHAGLQPLGDSRRRVGLGQHGQRRRPRALDGPGDRRGGALRARTSSPSRPICRCSFASTDGELLRERTSSTGGDDDGFYVFDEDQRHRDRRCSRSGASRSRAFEPALEGSFTVETFDGPGAGDDGLRALEGPAQGLSARGDQAITGVSPATVRNLARRIARARGLLERLPDELLEVLSRDGDGAGRASRLRPRGPVRPEGRGLLRDPAALGLRRGAFHPASGKYSPKLGIALMMALPMAPKMMQMKLAGYSDEMILYQLAREDYARGNLVSDAALPLPARRAEGALRQRRALGSRT